jgi:1-acyl-sn-glycerol-3-phosphate acyltransferase
VILYHALEVGGFRQLMRALFRIEVAGAERIPPAGPCIVVANHESLIDPFVLGVATERSIHWLAKAELWRNPLARFLMDGFAGVPVERGTGGGGAITRAETLLARGEALGVFPQGTCFPSRNRPYLRGAARLALATGAPLVPVCLIGTERALRPHRPRVGLPKLRVLVAGPLLVRDQKPNAAAARTLSAQVEQAIADLRRPYGEPRHVWAD